MTVIQSVVFNRPIEMEEAKAFLEKHNFKHSKVDITPHTYRFRQMDPHPLEAIGYRFRMIPFKHGHLVVGYPPGK